MSRAADDLTNAGREGRPKDLANKDLRNATFDGEDLSGALFHGSDLRGADFRGAVLDGSSFVPEAKLDAYLLEVFAHGREGAGDPPGAARLRGADFSEASLRRVDARGLDLRFTTLSGARFDEARLEGTRMSDPEFQLRTSDTSFRAADMRLAVMFNADLRRCDLSRARLTDAELYLALLIDCDLTDAILYGALLMEANLTGSLLGGAQLEAANLSGVSGFA